VNGQVGYGIDAFQGDLEVGVLLAQGAVLSERFGKLEVKLSFDFIHFILCLHCAQSQQRTPSRVRRPPPCCGLSLLQ
jgi:hypothetical protein